MLPKLLLITIVITVLLNYGEAIMCHRCNSAMGGCGADGVVWRMFPWRDCGDSKFCVKVITKQDGEEKILRECESELMKTAFHRLKMPVLRRHGYCRPARKNDFWNPLQTTDESIQYCFCNDWNGCNSASRLFSTLVPVTSLGLSVMLLLKNML
ncbi:uncharacterized protein LOC127868326 [Dreissena polymorpha]|uniref:Protein quiver n=1 Tax=Dreissena polymorpha TaxID=45954 RepID=A0A9D4M6J7_DREPO|nr:uncharacterized protein LOC127868326 [Dreissena polymorpha]KAH3870700.1 hypothetical protein DPMN_033891 [Dreissena polymorpha]